MDKIELDIVALSHSVSQSNNYAVVLSEQGGQRRLPIVIGAFEAQAIAVALERMTPNRPLTHDLFKNTLDTFDIELKEVIISDLSEGIFYAKLVCVQFGTEEIEIDSRTSDALALAVRFNCPVYTYDFILETAGIIMDGDDDPSEVSIEKREVQHPPKAKKVTLESYSSEALEKLLEEAVENEDYERAAKIRDELSFRGKNS